MEYLVKSCSHGKTIKPNQELFRMHAHDTYEIFCFLAGDADYYVEGNQYHLQPGDIMVMNKTESHFLMLKSDVPYERIVVNFDLSFSEDENQQQFYMKMFENRPLGQYNHYSSSLFPNNHWVFFLDKICEYQNKYQQLAFLLPLLAELSEGFETIKSYGQEGLGHSITSVIRYINNNLADDLSLTKLSERFYLSKAHLNRVFKRSTGSTIGNYIMIKRLLMARELLIAGHAPTTVCSRCGFRDYTTFYRAYKKQFGLSPKQDQIR